MKILELGSMEKLFIPYELALKLKELGFDEECLAGYIHLRGSNSWELAFYKDRIINFNKTSNLYVSAPLWQQTFDWFREKYRLNSFQDFYPTKENLNRAYFKIENHDSEKLYMDEAYLSGFFDNFEEARLGCLKKLIELCKKN